MSATEWIVIVQDGKFLGIAGRIVTEYPDAKVFTSWKLASDAREAHRKAGGDPFARVVSLAAYAEGQS